jgi:hypothetical protein
VGLRRHHHHHLPLEDLQGPALLHHRVRNNRMSLPRSCSSNNNNTRT